MGQEPEFKHIKITKLHPTFGAEVSGVDFSRPLSDEVFQETQGAMAKVRTEASSQGWMLTRSCPLVWGLRVPQYRTRRQTSCRVLKALW